MILLENRKEIKFRLTSIYNFKTRKSNIFSKLKKLACLFYYNLLN